MRLRGISVIVTVIIIYSITAFSSPYLDPSFLQSFHPEFLAGFLGVLLGFGFSFLIEDETDRRKGEKILEDMIAEIEKCGENLTSGQEFGYFGLPLQTDIWRMSISSGYLSSIDDYIRRKLSIVYSFIDRFNFKCEIYSTMLSTGGGSPELLQRQESELKDIAEICLESFEVLKKKLNERGYTSSGKKIPKLRTILGR